MIVYDLQGESESSRSPYRYGSIGSAERDLVSNGTDTSRAFFAAAQIAFQLNHSKDATDAEFLASLNLMQFGAITLAGKTESVEDIVAVGHYGNPFIESGISTARVHDLAVMPEYQRRCYGSAILAHIEENLAKQGVSVVELTTPDELKISFYERNGYAIQKDHKIRGMMSKNITPSASSIT